MLIDPQVRICRLLLFFFKSATTDLSSPFCSPSLFLLPFSSTSVARSSGRGVAWLGLAWFILGSAWGFLPSGGREGRLTFFLILVLSMSMFDSCGRRFEKQPSLPRQRWPGSLITKDKFLIAAIWVLRYEWFILSISVAVFDCAICVCDLVFSFPYLLHPCCRSSSKSGCPRLRHIFTNRLIQIF